MNSNAKVRRPEHGQDARATVHLCNTAISAVASRVDTRAASGRFFRAGDDEVCEKKECLFLTNEANKL